MTSIGILMVHSLARCAQFDQCLMSPAVLYLLLEAWVLREVAHYVSGLERGCSVCEILRERETETESSFCWSFGQCCSTPCPPLPPCTGSGCSAGSRDEEQEWQQQQQ